MIVSLQVFVSDDCWTCRESRRLVAEIAPEFPQVQIELLDLHSAQKPVTVFAVPTYVLNGRVISLGNPHLADLQRTLRAALTACA